MDQMTRDEFLYNQIKGNLSLNRGLAIVYGVATVAAIVMAIAAVVIERYDGAVSFAIFVVGLGYSAYSAWSKQRDFAAALEEIGPDPTGIDTCRTYSARTAQLIAQSRTNSKVQGQLMVAYGILAIVMIVLGGFLTVAMILMDGGVMLTALGALLAAGGLVLLVMAISAFRNWRAAKYLESLD